MVMLVVTKFGHLTPVAEAVQYDGKLGIWFREKVDKPKKEARFFHLISTYCPLPLTIATSV